MIHTLFSSPSSKSIDWVCSNFYRLYRYTMILLALYDRFQCFRLQIGSGRLGTCFLCDRTMSDKSSFIITGCIQRSSIPCRIDTSVYVAVYALSTSSYPCSFPCFGFCKCLDEAIVLIDSFLNMLLFYACSKAFWTISIEWDVFFSWRRFLYLGSTRCSHQLQYV